jgi:NADH dehydrogenase [ubiquinone] 1 alpha subcomplex assembly factor 5
MPDLFDMQLRAMHRDRAARTEPELFLFERAFDDCLERLLLMERRFERALLIGCPDARWPQRLDAVAGEVTVRDPGPLFAAAAGGAPIVEDAWEPPAAAFDLVLAIGTLDTVNGLPLALRLIRYAMRSDGLFIGVFAGGESLPRLRGAMRAADALAGGAAPHVHPRVEPSAVPALLESAGFVRPVVDVDRVQVSYSSLARLVEDLRGMGMTNCLRQRPPSLTRAQREAAARAFVGTVGQPAVETFEMIHFACATPPNG